MAKDPAQVVKLRYEFYRDNYRKVLMALSVAILIILFLVGTLFYLISHRPTPKYFATNSDGSIIELVPIDRPILGTDQILAWASEAARTVTSYNFNDFREKLQLARNYFTKEGFDDYLSALQETKAIDSVVKNRLTISAVVSAQPVILQEGLVAGRYSWRVQVPLTLTYQSPSKKTEDQVMVTMLITRVSTLDSAAGIGIAQILVSH